MTGAETHWTSLKTFWCARDTLLRGPLESIWQCDTEVFLNTNFSTLQPGEDEVEDITEDAGEVQRVTYEFGDILFEHEMWNSANFYNFDCTVFDKVSQ